MDRHSQALEYALGVLGREEHKKYIRAIYLYGSCAREEQKYSSDVDLFLLIEEDTPKKVIKSMRSDVVPEDVDLPAVELKMSKDVAFSSSRRFRDNLTKEGKLLWERA